MEVHSHLFRVVSLRKGLLPKKKKINVYMDFTHYFLFTYVLIHAVCMSLHNAV